MADKKVSTKKAPRVLRPQVIATTFTGSSDKLHVLRVLNFALAGVFALQAIAVLVFGTGTKFPVSISYLTADPLQTAAQGTTVRTLATHHVFDVNVLSLVVAALLIMAVAHLLQATWYRTRYEAGLQTGMNKLRWLGYAVMTSLLVLASGLVLGIQDVALLVAIISVSILQNLAGWAVERHDMAEPTRQKLSLLSGGLAGLTGIAILACYLVGSNTYGTATQGYVYWLFATDLAAFVLFSGMVFLRHRHIGKWADYQFADQVYMALGLVVASALAWQIFAGALTK